jgi:hypothetical protein
MSISVAVAFHRFACRLRLSRGLQGSRFGQRDQVQRSLNSFNHNQGLGSSGVHSDFTFCLGWIGPSKEPLDQHLQTGRKAVGSLDEATQGRHLRDLFIGDRLGWFAVGSPMSATESPDVP